MSVLPAATIWRDKSVDGVYSSDDHDPVKSEIREWASWVSSGITAGTLNGPWEATKAAIDLKLAYGDGNPGFVYAGADFGTYRKSGASGSGSWVKILDTIPGYQFVKAVDAGAGTANAIVATSAPPVAYSDGVQLIRLNIFETNTSGTVTVAFNGGAALTIQTSAGNPPSVGGLVAGMQVLGMVDQSGTVFRLLSDQASAAVLAAAEAAAYRAEAAASAVEGLTFDTLALAQAYAPASAPEHLNTAGNTSPGDGGGKIYKKVASEPSHDAKFSITLADAVTVVWYEVADGDVAPATVGALTSPNVAPSATYPSFSAGSGDQSAALQAWLEAPGYKKIGGGRKTYRLDSGLIIPANDTNALKIDLGNTVFDCSRFTPADLEKIFTATGTRLAQRPLGATASKGSYVVQISSLNRADLVEGMMVRIGSNAVWDSGSTNTRIGELNWIDDASTNAVTLKMPLRDTYLVADSSFCEPISDPMSGFELIGGVFFGPEATMNNVYGAWLGFMDNPKVIGTRFEYVDYLGVAFRSCFRGEADIAVSKTRPNTTGYGIAYFDACLGGRASGAFKDVRHAGSTNNSVGTEWGIVRDVVFRDMHALYSAAALGGGMAGGAAFDAHTGSENISLIDSTAQGATGPSVSFECPSATIRNFKSIDSQNTVAAILLNNKADRVGHYSVSGLTIDGSDGTGLRIQSAGQDISCDVSGFDVQRCASHCIDARKVTGGGFIGGGVVKPETGMRGVSVSDAVRMTVGPLTTIGGEYSVYFASDVTYSKIIPGSDGSASGFVLGSGVGNRALGDEPTVQSATVTSNAITLNSAFIKVVVVDTTAGVATLRTLSGGATGQLVAVRILSGTNALTVEEGGNIQTIGSAAQSLTTSRRPILLLYTGSEWLQLAAVPAN